MEENIYTLLQFLILLRSLVSKTFRNSSLGNLWRFPVLVFRHGGAAFLVAYITVLIFAALPMVFMEIVSYLNFRINRYCFDSKRRCYTIVCFISGRFS